MLIYLFIYLPCTFVLVILIKTASRDMNVGVRDGTLHVEDNINKAKKVFWSDSASAKPSETRVVH